jgi:hypothetical protein
VPILGLRRRLSTARSFLLRWVAQNTKQDRDKKAFRERDPFEFSLPDESLLSSFSTFGDASAKFGRQKSVADKETCLNDESRHVHEFFV